MQSTVTECIVSTLALEDHCLSRHGAFHCMTEALLVPINDNQVAGAPTGLQE